MDAWHSEIHAGLLTLVSFSLSLSRTKDHGVEEKGLFWEQVPQLTPPCSPHSCTSVWPTGHACGWWGRTPVFSAVFLSGCLPRASTSSGEPDVQSALATEDSRYMASKGQCP